MRTLTTAELACVSGGYDPYGSWVAPNSDPLSGGYSPPPVDISPTDASPTEPLPTHPSAAEVAISGAGLAASISSAVTSGGLAIPAALADLIDFLNNVSGYASTPSTAQINTWNTISSFGIVPGSIYITQGSDGGWYIDGTLNQITGNVSFQISWKEAVLSVGGEDDLYGGPIVEFF